MDKELFFMWQNIYFVMYVVYTKCQYSFIYFFDGFKEIIPENHQLGWPKFWRWDIKYILYNN